MPGWHTEGTTLLLKLLVVLAIWLGTAMAGTAAFSIIMRADGHPWRD